MQHSFQATLKILGGAMGLIWLGCQSQPTAPHFKQEIIVNAYLLVGSAIDSLYLSQALPINESYHNEKAAISTDSIFISVDQKQFRLFEYANKPGVYYLPADSLVIQPGKRYFFRARVGDKVVRASTLVPEQIHITGLSTDTTYYPYPNPLLSQPLIISWEKTPTAAAYQIAVIARTHRELVDFGMEELIESHLEAVDYDTARIFPLVSDFPVSKYENSIEILWIAFCYYGAYTIKVYAIDQNLWDLVTSPVVYAPQSSEYEQPHYHIEGGQGIFAALSVDSVQVYIKRQE